MSSSQDLPVMGEHGLDARPQGSNRGCLEEQEGGLLGTSRQGGRLSVFRCHLWQVYL